MTRSPAEPPSAAVPAPRSGRPSLPATTTPATPADGAPTLATPDPAGSTGTDPAAVAAAVAALPGLPTQQPSDRYGVRRLTAAWLAGFSPHTRTAYFRDLAHFLAWCQRDRLDPLRARPTDLQQYRLACEQPGSGRPVSAATVHRRLSALSSWYRYLAAGRGGGDAPANPVAGIRRPKVDRDASSTVGLTADQVRTLLASADAQAEEHTRRLREADTPHRRLRQLAALRDRALLRLLADLGLRIGEALALDLDALTHNRGRRTVRYLAKGGRWRERPLTGGAWAALSDYLAARAWQAATPVGELTGPLLATCGRGGAGRFTEPAAFRLVRRLARQAGLPSAGRLSPHSLRHAFATNSRELGVPLEDVQDAMGHADTRTTRRYDRGRFALERDPALRLGDLYHPPILD